MINRIKDIRGGKLNDSNFGSRMSGTGVYWDSIRDLFEISKKRFGLADKGAIDPDAAEETGTDPPSKVTEKVKTQAGQMMLGF